ncbi:hypothetical protein ACFY3U_15085 [Micromonospora sp. NPDC000089]|uniref:hypothetical protein n=1 Tax=unclassified Micromonospora TaxID=2617518 RepID=UPI0036CD3B30
MTDCEIPAAHAVWSAEQVAGELRATYLAVAAATVLLDRTSVGSAHPAIHLARRSGEDALDLAGDAEQELRDGIHRLRAEAGHREFATVGGLIEVLDTVRNQFGAAADRIARLPDRITAAGRQLAAADPSGLAAEAATEQWRHAAAQLHLMAQSLTSAGNALASYTGGLSGVDAATS